MVSSYIQLLPWFSHTFNSLCASFLLESHTLQFLGMPSSGLFYTLYCHSVCWPVARRQEMDGPQAKQFLPCGQTPRDSRNSTKAERWRRLSPPHIEDHIFLIFKLNDISLTMHVQKGCLEVKKRRGITS